MISPQVKSEIIVDSHCHLDLLEEKGFDIDEIIANAKQNNVEILQTICTKISEIDKITKFSDRYQNVFASAGVHPCNVEEEGVVSSEKIIEICKNNPKIIGIGETGLDYYWKKDGIENQKKSFLNHIEAAQELQIPVIIHSRDADQDMVEILTKTQQKKKYPALLHCFSSTKELALKALDLEIYISLSGILTFKNAKDLQEIAKEIPLEYLLVETDSPYLAPTPNRGKTNQPSYTKFVVEFLAELKNISAQEVAKITTENFFKLFSKAKI